MSGGLHPGVGPLAGALSEVAAPTAHYADCLRLREELAKTDPSDARCRWRSCWPTPAWARWTTRCGVVDRMLDKAGTDRQVLFQTACGLSILAAGPGDAAAKHLDRAFEVLTKLVDGGWQDPAGLQTDPDLDAVRKDKRFGELLRRLQGMKPEPDG